MHTYVNYQKTMYLHHNANKHTNSKYACTHMCEHTGQPYTHKQTRKTSTGAPASANTSIHTQPVGATNTQKREKTR